MLKNLEIIDDDDYNGTKTHNFNASDQTQRTLMMREETLLNSTRKLLGEEFERSDRVNLKPD